MKNIINLLIVLFTSQFAYSQSFEWVNSAGSNGADATEFLCSDSLNNIFSFGYFSDTLVLSNSNRTFVSKGNTDLFINKTDPQGNLIFTIHIGGMADEFPRALEYDNSGYIYILGSLSDSVYINKGSSTQLFYLDSNWQGANSSFLAKLDLNGNLIWTQFFESNYRIDVMDLVIDDSSNIAVVGSYEDTLDFGQIDSFNLVSNNFSGFISIFNSNSILIKTAPIHGSNGVFIKEIELGRGNYTITGRFRGIVDADPSSSTYNLQSVGGNDIFFCQYNSDLSFRWAKTILSNQQVLGSSLIQKNNYYYLSGVFSDTTYFDSNNLNSFFISNGQWDSFFSKYDSNGNLIWVKQFGDSLSEYTYSMDISNSNKIYLTGFFHGTTDFDPDTSTFLMNSNNGSRDFFISEFDTNGVFYWAKSIGGNYLDYGYDILFQNNELYIAGAFSNTVDFDFDSNQVFKSSFGDTDAYLLKLQLNIITSLNDYSNKDFIGDALYLFPNPSSEIIKIKGNLKGIRFFKVYDIRGRLVMQTPSFNTNQINISDLNAGAFILHSIYENGSVDKTKFIKTE